ncbi:MAG: hypothetical protein AAB295_06285 [Chloroflexota bacterium]
MSIEDEGVLRDVTREVLAELLPGLLEEALAAPAPNGNGNRHRAQSPDATVAEGDAVVPQVPAPPVAKVHRPSGWRAPAPSMTESPAEHPAPAAMPDGATVECVALRSDADLDAFVRALVRRSENPRNRMAILSGKVRFQLAAAPAASASAAPAIRVEMGAVTERAVKEAAKAGARLVLSPRAVLTPMARDCARSLGIDIEKEKPC